MKRKGDEKYVRATNMPTKAAVVEGIKPCFYQRKTEIRVQKPALMDRCFCLVMPIGIAQLVDEHGVQFHMISIMDNDMVVGCGLK